MALGLAGVVGDVEQERQPAAGKKFGENLAHEVGDDLPASQGAQARVEPVYETLEGWKGTTAGARSWNDLPAQAVKYIRRIEELIDCPVASVSTSPERDDTILVRDPFED